ncbi:MAG: exodeoxyribonuclease III [Paracoccaceae bacterium]|nr:MAG: exodeoxyribonuclease III [Alphaproteobacteria bacterium]GIX12378.1 MAG: exodeoxyribonuclease III [Paracoccaceae bacterium]
MTLTVCSWNINSLRLREGLVRRLLERERPDILCLQELKGRAERLPLGAFADLGYRWVVARTQKGYNGVAIISRIPVEDAGHHDFCALGDARHVAARLPGGIVIENFYVPAGGDIPDPEANPKFDHKLRFLREMAARCAAAPPRATILAGDLNIAPREDDVWSHRQLLDVVSHTPVEVAHLDAVARAGGWADVIRTLQPEGRLYSWWSYRARDWDASDRGRRLDHVWASPDLIGRARGWRILREARGWEQPSDHAPVLASFDLDPA